MIIRAKDRHFNDAGWLKTYWLFSFSDYYDENNVELGNLRVFNDDIVKAGKGFGMHPHSEMEIVTIILEGELTHQDDQGNKDTIKKGEVQIMTAGTGIVHSEWNYSDKDCHLYQIWLYPNKKGLNPSYRKSGELNSDAKVHVLELKKGERLDYKGKIFIYLTEGKLEVNKEIIEKNDQSRSNDADITALDDSKFVLVEC